jgi:hypothetical protein
MEYKYILNTILIFFTSTHWKISSIGAFLHNSFAGRIKSHRGPDVGRGPQFGDPCYNGLMGLGGGVISDERYNRVNGYSRKYTGYIANTRNKHRNSKCDYITVSILEFFLLAYFLYFEEIKVGLCDLNAVCVSVYSPY